MELRLIVLSVAVFSCLVPPALSTGVIATKAALAAAKGAAVIGAGVLAKKAFLAKGLLAGIGALAAASAAKDATRGATIIVADRDAITTRGAGVLATKAAVVESAVSLVKKGAALGGAILGAKAAALRSILTPPIPYAVRHRVAIPSLTPVRAQVVSPHIVETVDARPQFLVTRGGSLWNGMRFSAQKNFAVPGNLVRAVGPLPLLTSSPAFYDVAAPVLFGAHH